MIADETFPAPKSLRVMVIPGGCAFAPDRVAHNGDIMGQDANHQRARSLLHTATRLMALAHDLERDVHDSSGVSITKLEPSDSVLVELARQIYSARRKRSVLTGWHDLFGEPAWDMLLDLFIAAHECRDVSVMSACLAADVPGTTALRWLHLLENRGLLLRQEDPHDHRRSLVRISTTGFAEFIRYLRHIADGHSAFVLLAPHSQAASWPTVPNAPTKRARSFPDVSRDLPPPVWRPR